MIVAEIAALEDFSDPSVFVLLFPVEKRMINRQSHAFSCNSGNSTRKRAKLHLYARDMNIINKCDTVYQFHSNFPNFLFRLKLYVQLTNLLAIAFPNFVESRTSSVSFGVYCF